MKKSTSAALVSALLAIGACGGTVTTASQDSNTVPVPTERSSPGGWVGAPPDFKTAGGGGVREGLATAAADRAASAPATLGLSPSGPVKPVSSGLRAGSVDDNAKFDDYLSYRTRFGKTGVPVRELDPTGRIVVTVKGSDGMPAAGQDVVVTAAGKEVATLRALADGTVRFHPLAYGVPGPFTFTVGKSSAGASSGAVTLALPEKTAPNGKIPIDVLFVLDATGSMGDEIARLKTTIDSVGKRLASLPSQPDLRLGMTVYRDQGDAFVARTFDFASDVSVFSKALAEVTAAGGGDKPEAVDEALAAALSEPKWRDSALKLVFVVADAGPHVERELEQPYTASMKLAAQRGVKIHPIASSGTDDLAEYVFRQLAQFTGGRFVFMSYGAEGGGAAIGGSSNISTTDYEELSLDDLVVRLVAEELAARAGEQTAVVPPTSSTSTTRPAGQ